MTLHLRHFQDGCLSRTGCNLTTLAVGAGLVVGGSLMGMLPLEARADTSDVASQLVPHRAVYEITLEKASTGSGIAQLTGRMVFEHRGSKCEGYRQSVRFVTRSVDTQGEKTLSDMRASTWEAANGKGLQFDTSTFQNKELVEEVSGAAKRGRETDQIDVEIEEPERRSLTLPANVQLPVQHSIALLKAAAEGAQIMHADLFDGTDKDGKVFETTTIIGSVQAPGADAALPKGANIQSLSGMKSWPVSISYFEKNNDRSDGVPVYELAFRFYENGVSSRLFIAYESFSVRGALTSLTYFDPINCKKNRATDTNRRADATR